jgi:uncharacterized cupin superfamily protein
MEQLMPAKAGPPPHVHDQGEEVFYILDGEMPGAQRPATTDR